MAGLDAAVARTPALRELLYWLQRYRRVWRGTVVISVVNPLLFLAAMGAGLGSLVDRGSSPYLQGHSYLAFLAPGPLAAAAMQNAYVDGAGPVFQSSRATGNYRAAATTPMSPADIFIGHLLFMAFRILVSGVLFIAVMVVFGVVAPVRALLLVPAVLLTGLAFATPSAAFAVTVDRPARLNAVFRFVILPLYMFSGTFYAVSQLPDWLRHVALVTPLYQGVELCRTLALGTATVAGTATHAAYLLGCAAVGAVLARRAYAGRLHG